MQYLVPFPVKTKVKSRLCEDCHIYTSQVKLSWSVTGMEVFHTTTRLIMVKLMKKLHTEMARKTRSETKQMNGKKMTVLSWISWTCCKIVFLWKGTSFYMIRTIEGDLEITVLLGRSVLLTYYLVLPCLVFKTLQQTWTSNKGIRSDHVGDLYKGSLY